ncbi:dual specificity protein phosphatase 22 isoform X2 [Phacochoerus africanus]|uniref:dual specificity protein phosphatase 22 isoform X2 n=1 Tax=Phacochoerus africanus TaxID=41426 RepID=UPI001FD9C466|nr:dual specificity protein phosphatase 22 isoform X2 [Phacochoerus africanus]
MLWFGNRCLRRNPAWPVYRQLQRLVADAWCGRASCPSVVRSPGSRSGRVEQSYEAGPSRNLVTVRAHTTASCPRTCPTAWAGGAVRQPVVWPTRLSASANARPSLPPPWEMGTAPLLGAVVGRQKMLLEQPQLPDARDAEQLSKNKVTHILSVHDSARPMLEDKTFQGKHPVHPRVQTQGRGLPGALVSAGTVGVTGQQKLLFQPAPDIRQNTGPAQWPFQALFLSGEFRLHILAGVSRSVTLVVAYVMTVTDLGWEDALHTVRAGRSCANPNLGFQRQLQEFEEHHVHQYRQWLKEEYGESPLRDAEEARSILARRAARMKKRSWPLPKKMLQHSFSEFHHKKSPE